MIHQLFNLLNWLGSEWVLGLLGLLSVVMVAIALQRWSELRQLGKQSNRFWQEIGNPLFSGDSGAWQQLATEQSSSYKSLEAETLDVARKADKRSAEQVINAYLEHRKIQLEKNVGVLGTIGANAAFIGLLGTVIGVIRAFAKIASSGVSGGIETVGGGIAEALVATAVGLCVAIPAVVLFNALNRQILVLVKKAHNAGDMAVHYLNGRKG